MADTGTDNHQKSGNRRETGSHGPGNRQSANPGRSKGLTHNDNKYISILGINVKPLHAHNLLNRIEFGGKTDRKGSQKDKTDKEDKRKEEKEKERGSYYSARKTMGTV
jgi:hypothetical protein